MTQLKFTTDSHFQTISEFLCEKGLYSFADLKSHSFDFLNSSNEKVIKLGLPLNYKQPHETNKFNEYLEEVKNADAPNNGVLIFIQAGEAAIGVFSRKELLKYKVIRKYMVRKKQGKAQLLHLKTKGKSRAGSRIRLAQSIKFFEEINEVLAKYLVEFDADLIVYGISPALMPHWFNSNVPVPFSINDSRLRKVNWTMGLPRKETLEKGLWHIYSSRISIFDPHYLPDIKKILEQ